MKAPTTTAPAAAATAPPPPTETELKLAVSAGDLPRLRARLARLGAARRDRLTTTYFDTAERLLAGHGMVLRLRKGDDGWVQTLKAGAAASAFGTRGEWETVAPGGRLQLGRLRATPLPALLAAHGKPALVPLFETRFVRSARTVPLGKSLVEVALDRGHVVAGRARCARRLPLLELELELKSGRPSAIFKLARRLLGGDGVEPLALLPLAQTKAARGYRLLDPQPPAPVKAGAKGFAAPLRAQHGADQALRQVIGHGTEVLLANARGLAEHDDPEFVHQARVALRRMRSAVRLWRREARLPQPLQDELKWIGQELGALRDADVLVTETLPHLAAAVPPAQQPALQALADLARQRQAQARVSARAALASGRFARLALDLLAWAHGQPKSRAASLRKLAPRQLARLLARLRAAARFFAALTPERRHEVRIRAKRLRYALDLFAVALPAQPTAEYLERLAHLQDLLGELNDVAVARAALDDLGAGEALRAAIAEGLAAREAAGLKQAEVALAQLFETRAPWG